MKTSLQVLVAFVVLACAPVRTPAQTGPEYDLFLIGGYNHSNLTGGNDRLLGNDPDHGFIAGAGVQLRMQDTYAIDVGLRYAREGGGGTIDSTFAVPNLKDVTEAVGSADVVLDYVQIPIMFSFLQDLNESSYIRFFLGPSLNMLVRARLKGTASGKSIDQDIKHTMQSAQVAGVVGAGYVVDFDTWRLSADVSYSQGLSTVTNSGDIKTRSFRATVGVGIPLAR